MSEKHNKSQADSDAKSFEFMSKIIYDLATDGNAPEMIRLTDQWAEELQSAPSSDPLDMLELAILRAWALYSCNDYHAANDQLIEILGHVSWMLDSFTRPGNKADIDRLERANRVKGNALNQLGQLFTGPAGNIPAGLEFLRAALDLRKENPKDRLAYAQTLANIAGAEQKLGHPEAALAALEEAIGVLEKNADQGPFSEYPEMLANLGDIHHALENQDLARTTLERALSAAISQFGADSMVTARIHARLGYLMLSDWDMPHDADRHLTRALIIAVRSRAESSSVSVASGNLQTPVDLFMLLDPFTSNVGVHLAWSCWKNGEQARSIRLIERYGVRDDILLRHACEMASEDRRLARLTQERFKIDLALSMTEELPGNSMLRTIALEAVMRRKGLGMLVSAEMAAVPVYRRSEQGEGLRTKAISERAELTRGMLGEILDKDLSDLRMSAELSEFMAGTMQRRNDMRRISDPAFDADDLVSGIWRLVRWTKPVKYLSEALPEDGALVEFVFYLSMLKRENQQVPVPRLGAFVLVSRSISPAFIPLGSVKEILSLMADYHSAVGAISSTEGLDHDLESDLIRVDQTGSALRERIFDPIVSALDGRTKLTVGPDGPIAAVSLASLPFRECYLVNYYEISYYGNLNDLTGSDVNEIEAGPPIVIADPDFDAGAPENPEEREGFGRLPFTRTEGLDVGALLGVEPLMGEAACEACLRDASSPVIVHIACHGWHLGQTVRQGKVPGWARHPRLRRLFNEKAPTWRERSGLALAGFNSAWAGFELPPDLGDGLLTAGDACNLNLAGTSLVVLSACETGQADTFLLEGDYGLRRAMLVAGARSVISSAWQIPDRATQEFMHIFYDEICKGSNKSAALRRAAINMQSKFSHPYYWGSFMLYGGTESISFLS